MASATMRLSGPPYFAINSGGIALADDSGVASETESLWEVHIRVPPHGPLAVSCKRAGRYFATDVVRFASPADALRFLEKALEPFAHGDQLFITARNHDGKLSLWNTSSRGAGLYWCAVAVAQLWRTSGEFDALAAPRQRTVA